MTSSGLHKEKNDTQPRKQKCDHSSDCYERLVGERNKKEKRIMQQPTWTTVSGVEGYKFTPNSEQAVIITEQILVMYYG